jgi:hypothetical protein
LIAVEMGVPVTGEHAGALISDQGGEIPDPWQNSQVSFLLVFAHPVPKQYWQANAVM